MSYDALMAYDAESKVGRLRDTRTLRTIYTSERRHDDAEDGQDEELGEGTAGKYINTETYHSQRQGGKPSRHNDRRNGKRGCGIRGVEQ